MTETGPKEEMENAAKALRDHISNQEEAQIPTPEGEEEKDVDPVEYVALTVAGLESSVKSLHMAIAGLSSRMDSMEHYISYLLSKDPEVGPKMQEQADKMAAEQAKAETESTTAEKTDKETEVEPTEEEEK